MEGHIYITGKGIDPGKGDLFDDPIFTGTVSLGACMPNIRRVVKVGDHIFVVSGKSEGVQQYIVGGFQVKEKLDALAAYDRYPENRLRRNNEGEITGNIIVTNTGEQHPLDNHPQKNFSERIKNYIIGESPVFFSQPDELERARADTLPLLGELFEKPGNRIIDIMGRHHKLNTTQVNAILEWMREVRNE